MASITLTEDLITGTLVLSGTDVFDAAGYNVTVLGGVAMDNTGTDMGTGDWSIGGDFDYEDVVTFTPSTAEITLTGLLSTLTVKTTADLYGLVIGDTASTTFVNDTSISNVMQVKGEISIANGVTADADDLQIFSGGILGGSGTYVCSSGQGISKQDGVIDCDLFSITDDHNAADTYIVPGLYNSLASTISGGDFDGQAGTYLFGGATTITDAGISNTGNSSNWELQDDLTIAGTTTWAEGDGQLIFSGGNDQAVDLNSLSYEDIYIEKAGTSSLIFDAGWSASSLLAKARGIVDFNGQSVAVDGDFIMAGPQISGANLSGTDITVGGNLNINGSWSTLNLSSTALWNMTVNGDTAIMSRATIDYCEPTGAGINIQCGNSTDGGNNSGLFFITDVFVINMGLVNQNSAVVLTSPYAYKTLDYQTLSDSGVIEAQQNRFDDHYYYSRMRKT